MDNLKVNFVAQGSAYLASQRMRVTKPAELLNVGVMGIEVTTQTKSLADADINIFNKHFDQKANYMAVCSGEDLGYYSVFDVCDDHFDRPHGKFYEMMCEKADAVTCNSANMQERIFEVTGKLARIIPDPITFPKGEFIPYQSERTPNCLWYGHGSNAEALLPWLDHLGVRVTAICDAGLNHNNVDYVNWKPMVVEKRIMDADIVLIPTTNHSWTKCKSPNRAVDAIRAGKFVITDSREIYGDLEPFIYIIESLEDLPAALSYWKENPEEVQSKVERGQKFIEELYGDERVLEGWLNVFRDLGLVENFEGAKDLVKA